jgi:FkbM family methyltransferase
VISYAQNHEDVVLARVFAGQPEGFYIDVGAEDPVINSVTKHFYELGWRGINVEPSARSLAALEADRPDDVNLGVGLAMAPGKVTFYEGPPDNHGASTFVAAVAARYESTGQAFTSVSDVPVTTLAAVCDEYVGDRQIDFIKIDVEGSEADVITGGDWVRWRPRVVVVEATYPNSTEPAYHAWEPALLRADYLFALFDGLNRFYVSAEEAELLDALSSPACVFDDFTDALQEEQLTLARATVAALATELAGWQARAAELDEARAARVEMTELRAGLAEAQGLQRSLAQSARERGREVRIVRDQLAELEEEVLRRESAAAALRDRIGIATAATEAAAARHLQAEAARQELQRELDALRATRTFRWTAGLRGAYARFRRMR